MTHNTSPVEPIQAYGSRRAAAVSELEQQGRRARALSWARLIVAFAIVFAVAAVFEARADLPWRYVVIGALIFLVLVVLHRRAMSAVARSRETIQACDAGLARTQRDWDSLPPLRVAAEDSPIRRALAKDLDVTGAISLMRLLDVGLPALGGGRVQQWLLGPPPPVHEILGRQESVNALRTNTDFLLQMSRVGARSTGHPSSLTRFTEWCHRDDDHRGRVHASVALILTAGIAAAGIAQVLDTGSALPARALMVLLVAQAIVAGRARRVLERSLRGVDDVLTQLRGVEASMRSVVEEKDVPGSMGKMQDQLRRGAVPALNQLARIVAWNEMRLAPLPHFLANLLVGFDALLLGALERWRRRHAAAFPAWLSQLADAEGLVALATLAHDNPDWSMPTVHEDGESWIVGTEIAHPLLPPDRAVANDVRIGTNGEVMIVSGSNMSGKTTYLRAVGLNALLAQAGGPVRGHQLSLRRCIVRTSVRVEDDLGQGVSLFLAEVNRLQQVVRDAEATTDAPVLFLFDEILHGTNASDRREATRLVLDRLARAGASGVVTTHDPAIADQLEARSYRHAHFEEQIELVPAPAMRFDYRMRSGPATTANALFVLRSALGDPPAR